MNIGMVSALWGPAYPTGSGVYAFELANRLAERGCSVRIMTTDVGKHNGYRYHKNIRMDILESKAMAWDMNPVVNVLPYMSDLDLDILHIHSYIYFLSNAMAFLGRLKDVRTILHFHGGVAHSRLNNGTDRRMWMKNHVYDPTLGRFTASCADKVFSVSKSDMPMIENKFGVRPEYMNNAVSTDLFHYNRDHEEKLVTYVGKLETWKGAELLLPIFEKIYEKDKNVHFRIVGTGSLDDIFEDSGLPLEIVGHVPHMKMEKIYQESSLTILPSYMEGAPTTCMEALACGTPVIATDVGDTSEIVLDGKNGYICDVEDVSAIANRALELLHDNEKRESFGLAGREWIENNFSYDILVDKLLAHYIQMLQDSRRAHSRSDNTITVS